MTVQDLIDRLQQVKDKSKKIVLYTAWVDSEGDYNSTDHLEIDCNDIEETSSSFIIEGCVVPW